LRTWCITSKEEGRKSQGKRQKRPPFCLLCAFLSVFLMEYKGARKCPLDVSYRDKTLDSLHTHEKMGAWVVRRQPDSVEHVRGSFLLCCVVLCCVVLCCVYVYALVAIRISTTHARVARVLACWKIQSLRQCRGSHHVLN
jgi:hypothetical protein